MIKLLFEQFLLLWRWRGIACIDGIQQQDSVARFLIAGCDALHETFPGWLVFLFPGWVAQDPSALRHVPLICCGRESLTPKVRARRRQGSVQKAFGLRFRTFDATPSRF